VAANGGAGLKGVKAYAGGGSGGAVLLAASSIRFNGTVSATGGNSGLGNNGGNGGGGRVAFYSTDDFGAPGPGQEGAGSATPIPGVNVAAGTGGNGGAVGTFYDGGRPPMVGEKGLVLVVR
jgi:hypothetical protein